LAILRFCNARSRETRYNVIKSVIRLASQLKLKGYMIHGCKRDDADKDDNNNNNDKSSDTDNSESHDESGSDDYYRRAWKRRKPMRWERLKASRRREKGSKCKSRKGGKGDRDSGKEQLRRLSSMIENMMKVQQATITPSTPIMHNHPEPNIIHRNTYAIANNNGRLPPSAADAYKQQNACHTTTRLSEYPNRRNPLSADVKYNQKYH